VPKVGTGSASSETGVEGPSDGTPTTSGVGTGETPSSGPAVPATSSSSPSPAPTPPTVTASEVICTSPPPACPSGQAPSYAPAGFWHCLPLCNPEDSSLVVISYGSTYGNGGVCAGPPPLFMCATPGDVWTWNYLTEAWQCEPKCDNGQYDQRSYEGEIVCVPC
jgi:hypothetical protein